MNGMEFALLTTLLLSLMCTTQLQAEVLSAADVIRLVRAQDPAARAAREAVALSKAEYIEAGIYANPALVWDREHLRGEVEDSFLLTLPIDLSTARSTRQHLANANVAVANAHAARAASDVVVRALTVFYGLMGEERRSVIHEYGLARLVEAARVVRRRREEGSASGYDQSRIEIETELAASSLRQMQTAAELHRLELANLLGVVASEVSFVGTLEPDRSIIVEPALDLKNGSQPSLRLLRAAARRAGEARDAATWSWLPGLVISGGPRLDSGATSRTGYQLGIAVDLPIFSRGQELRSRAAARERYAQAYVEAAEQAAHIKRMQAREGLTAARLEVQRFADATGDRIERLQRAAQSGYREGELSIVELLDAQRVRTHLEVRQLELVLALKEAEVALCAARGDYE